MAASLAEAAVPALAQTAPISAPVSAATAVHAATPAVVAPDNATPAAAMVIKPEAPAIVMPAQIPGAPLPGTSTAAVVRPSAAAANTPASAASTTAAIAAEPVVSAAPADDPLFPHLPVLKVPVAFWTKVFSEWSENQSVLHSSENLGRVYAVLDFRADAAVLSPNALAALKAREERAAYLSLNTALTDLQAMVDKNGVVDVTTLTDDQRRAYDMFSDSRNPTRFRDAMGTFRIQRGLRERTQRALETSGRYLPEMERIFTGYSLPPKLTRLPLVESSFNVDAYSKAAAAGLWQFIPASARIYMRLNDIVDDRRDPWLSTDAAARHLKDDFEALGNWPLALTAYNYGRGGLARALSEVGGSTLTEVIERFQNKRFGFASSNFYAEFLAASDVEHDYRKHFGDITREPPLAFETVSTRDYVPYATLRKLCGTDDDEFHRLNPAYRPEVVEGKLYVPPGHTIRVPAGAAQRFQLAYATLSPGQRFDRQRQLFASHLVARGETLGKLAARYNVSQQQLLAVNGLSSAKKVRAGQTLKIPMNEGASTIVASADPAQVTEAASNAAWAAGSPAHVQKVKPETLAAAKFARVRTHRVTSGQTLGAIARRYQTSIEHLRQLNGFGKSDVLHVGSTIKVPGG